MENFLLAHEMNEIVGKGKQQATEIQIVEIFSVVSSTFLYLTFSILLETKKNLTHLPIPRKINGFVYEKLHSFSWVL